MCGGGRLRLVLCAPISGYVLAGTLLLYGLGFPPRCHSVPGFLRGWGGMLLTVVVAVALLVACEVEVAVVLLLSAVHRAEAWDF